MAPTAVASPSRAQRTAIEAARGALQATHAAAGLVGENREGKRLLHAAEGMCRAAVAVLMAAVAPAAAGTRGEGGDGGGLRRRRKRGKKKKGDKGMDVDEGKTEGGARGSGQAGTGQQAIPALPGVTPSAGSALDAHADVDAYLEGGELMQSFTGGSAPENGAGMVAGPPGPRPEQRASGSSSPGAALASAAAAPMAASVSSVGSRLQKLEMCRQMLKQGQANGHLSEKHKAALRQEIKALGG